VVESQAPGRAWDGDFHLGVRWARVGPARVHSPAGGPHSRESAISDVSLFAALVSIGVSLWVGLALLMGVLGARRLPAASSQGSRLVFGALTLLLWYVALLAAMAALAMVTVRTFGQLGSNVFGLGAATALVWGLRRLIRDTFVSPARPDAALGSGPGS